MGLGPVRTPVEQFLVPDVSFVSSFWILDFVFAIASTPCDFLYLNNEYTIQKRKEKEKKKPPILLVLYATWYFFHDSCTSEYNLFYSDIQDPRQGPTNPDPDLPLCDQP